MPRPAKIAVCLLVSLAALARADDAAPPSYEDQVAPLLAARCQKCHSGEMAKSGFDVTSPEALARGGESGPAVVPGQAAKSMLVELIADGSMPPDDEPKLTAEELGLVRRWIDAGAKSAAGSPSADAATDASAARIDSAAREFWAFRPLAEPAVPAVASSQAHTSVDAFVLAALQKNSLSLAPEADRLTLLRRASFDLIGLPPTVDEIEAFLADERPDAYERLVDRLLASAHFGERWGRHWLDAAGYSDITGGDNDAGIIKLSEGKWKYRDWVVRAYNDDMPYDRFLIEQLAGDELVDWRRAEQFTPEIEAHLVATGFLRNAADDTDENELKTPDIIHGVLQRTGEVVANNLLGLTLACAKCHDHKYEPIPQQDYYRLLANFTPTFNPASWTQPKDRALADVAPVERARREKHNADLDGQIKAIEAQLEAARQPVQSRRAAAKYQTLPEAIREDVRAAVAAKPNERNEVQKYLAEKFKKAVEVSPAEVNAALGEAEKQQIASGQQRIGELNETRQAWGKIQAAYDVGPPPDTHLLRRGNHETPAGAVEPGFLAVLCETNPRELPAENVGRRLTPVGETSGRRLAMAQWITDWKSPAGGLAARVMVNRSWQHLFGRGIVETTENLGVSGASPTHPELLKWLACRYVAEGGRLKPLLKLIVTSAVYRQASTSEDMTARAAAASEVDPSNRLLWRMPLRRIEAEIVRDAILATSGQLDRSLGGPSLPLEVQSDGMVVIQNKAPGAPANGNRRSLYVLARRNYHLSMLGVFDQPAMSMNCPNRQQSAVVLQSLTMLNDALVLDAAERFARRVTAEVGGEKPEQIARAFEIALARKATAGEMAWSSQLLETQAGEYAAANLPVDKAAEKALAHLCHMLLNSNEFLYVQ